MDSSENWKQVGNDIDGEAAYDSFGYSVSLSSDGETFTAGGRYNGGNGYSSGHVRVYQLDSSENWKQLEMILIEKLRGTGLDLV